MTCGWDSSIYLWKLYPDKVVEELGTINENSKACEPVWEFKLKNNTFNCVSIYRPEGENCEPVVFATCTDKSSREIKTVQVKVGEV